MHTEKYEGFDIVFEAIDEDMSPDDSYDWGDEDHRKEFYGNIESGKWVWFCAKVTASRHDIVLATVYLGGCCYESIDQFIQDVYYEELRNTVVSEAGQVINKLIGDK